MENNLPAKYKEGIFSKITNFFRNMFRKKTLNQIVDETSESNVNQICDLKEDIKSKLDNDLNYFKNMNKEQFVEQFEENPDLLYNLTIEQLEKLDRYYDEIIEEYRIKTEKLA